MSTLLATLLSNAVTASVLAIVVFAAAKRIRHQGIAHGLWILVLLKLITPSFVSLPFAIPVDNSWLTLDARQVFAHLANAGSEVTAEMSGSANPAMFSATDARSGVSFDRDSSGRPSAGSPWSNNELARRTRVSLSQIVITVLVLTWMLGTGVYVLRLLIRYVRFCRFLKRNEQVDEELISEGYDLAYKMGLQRPPRVRVLSGAFSPMLCGLGRGLTLILPVDLLHRLSPQGRATLVVHELTHYARGDYLVRVLETVVTAVFWWHPVVWWVRRELEIVEEDCCDARVVAEFPGEPRHYAEAILDAIDILCERPVLMPPVSSGLGTAPMLKRRLTRIMTEAPVPGSPRWGRFTVLASAIVVLPLQLIHFRPEPANAEVSLVMTVRDAPSPSNARDHELSAEAIDAILHQSCWCKVRSPDGRWILQADEFQHCRMVSASERRSVDLPESIASCVIFSPDSQQLALGTADGHVLIFRAPDWSLIRDLPVDSAVRSIDWSPAADRIALCTEAGDVKILNAGRLHCTATRRLPISVLNCIRFSPEGDQLMVGCGNWKTGLDSALLLLDARTLKLRNGLDLEFPVALVWLRGQDGEIVSCDWSGQVSLRQLSDWKLLNSQWIPKDLIAPMAFSAQADVNGVMSQAF